jgi:hypothetical protein
MLRECLTKVNNPCSANAFIEGRNVPSSILAPMSSVEREMTPEVTIPRKKDGKRIRLLKDKTRQIPKRTTHAWLNAETEHFGSRQA